MKQILLALLLFVAGCGGLDELVSDLADEYEEYEEEYYECYPGDARLPFGTYPEELITPEGYKWECIGGNVDSIYINSDGTFSATLNSAGYQVALDYFSDCPGYASREQTSEWVVHLGKVCTKSDDLQPGLYGCQRFTHYESLNQVTFTGYVDFYENGLYIGNQYEPSETCTLAEE